MRMRADLDKHCQRCKDGEHRLHLHLKKPTSSYDRDNYVDEVILVAGAKNGERDYLWFGDRDRCVGLLCGPRQIAKLAEALSLNAVKPLSRKKAKTK